MLFRLRCTNWYQLTEAKRFMMWCMGTILKITYFSSIVSLLYFTSAFTFFMSWLVQRSHYWGATDVYWVKQAQLWMIALSLTAVFMFTTYCGFSLQTLTQMPRCSQSWASLQQSADLRWWKMLTLAAHLLDTSLSLVSNASVKGLKTNQTVFHWAVFWVPQFKNGKHFDWREESKIHTVCTLCSELLEETLDRKWNASHWQPVHCLLSHWAGDYDFTQP